MDNISDYSLYGKILKVSLIKDDELLVMEGLQYITPVTGGDVYVLQSISPKSRKLIGCEYHSGNIEVLNIDDSCYCENPIS